MDILPKSGHPAPSITTDSDKHIDHIKESGYGIGQSNSRQRAAATVQVSDLAKDFSRALLLLENDEKARPEAIDHGNRVIDQWDSLRDDQIDKILLDLMSDGL